MTDHHPFSHTFCHSCGSPDGVCSGVKATDIDLGRQVPDIVLDVIRREVGVSHESGITVGELIRAEAGIGYGGHFDESSDEEDNVLAIAALDDFELNGMHAARYEYTALVRSAADAIPLLVEALGDAIEYREPLNIGCCPDNAMCEDHAGDQAKADEYTALLHALTRTHQEAPDA